MRSKIFLSVLILVIITICLKEITELNTIVTPEIHGKFIDSVTGKGIQNVILKVKWLPTAKYIIGNPEELNYLTVITAEDGGYKIPEYTGIHIFTSIKILMDTVHPLYADTEGIVMPHENNRDKTLITDSKSVKYDIELTNINRQYIKTENYEEFWNKIETYENGWYWKVLKENKIEYNINEIFDKWMEEALNIDKTINSINSADFKTNSFQNKVKNAKEGILKNLDDRLNFEH